MLPELTLLAVEIENKTGRFTIECTPLGIKEGSPIKVNNCGKHYIGKIDKGNAGKPGFYKRHILTI